MSRRRTTALVFMLLVIMSSGAIAGPSMGTLTGSVEDRATHQPLVGATVRIIELSRARETDSLGQYRFESIIPGSYTIRVSHVGYSSRQQAVRVTDSLELAITFSLRARPVTLPGITVHPGAEPFVLPTRLGASSLTPAQVRATPQFGEDIYRAATRLPGVTGNDFSSRFIVRGGEHDQVLVTLDGMELEEPFHLKDVDGGVISIIDVSAIREVSLATGGFGAEYGDRLSGVFDLKTRAVRAADPNYGVSISLTNFRANGEGTFLNRRGSWLGSARRGYLDLVTDFDGEFEELTPRYYDAFGKVSYRLSLRQELSAHVLHAHDNLRFSEDGGDRSRMIHDDSYAWLTLASRWTSRLTTSTILSTGRLEHDRSGEDLSSDFSRFRFRVEDRRDYRFVGLKHDLTFQPSGTVRFSTGGELKTMSADYDYHKEWLNYTYVSSPSGSWYSRQVDTTARDLAIRGDRWAGYLSSRIRLLAPLTIETGVRYDVNTYADDRIVSPRVNLEYQVLAGTSLRIAWGRYAQAQKIYELDIPDNDPTFYPAERAEHRVIGLLQQLPAELELRVEAYDKRLSDLKPEYRNWMETVYLFPEASDDRVLVFRSGERSRGIEFYLADQSSRAFTWRVAYALAEVTQRIDGYLDDNRWVPVNEEIPGEYDQRHSFMADLAWQTETGWSIAAAWQYRTGWTYSSAVASSLGVYDIIAPGGFNDMRYEPYTRLDIRVGRDIAIGNGDLRLFVEIMNVLDQASTRLYEYDLDCSGTDGCRVTRTGHDWLGILPSVGISWRFGR